MNNFGRWAVLAALMVGTATSGFSGVRDHGVFFDNHDVPTLRRIYSGHPAFADLRHQMDTIDRVRERAFLRGQVRTNDQLYDIARVSALAQEMALLFVYTGDADAANLAKECVETLMRFPKWDYFLEGGKDVIGLQRAPQSALAVALVVDVLRDSLPPTTVDRWLQTMAQRGTEPCFRATYGMRYPDSVRGWCIDTTSTYFTHRPLDRSINLARWPVILNTINLKAIPASALALSALAYRSYFGETVDTQRWLEQALFSIRTFRDIYARDGSYNEGVSYAHYTTLHLIQAVDALARNGVADVTDLLNWKGYQNYLLELSLPTSNDTTAIVNFGDAGTGASASVSFWIARHTRDGHAQWFGEQQASSRDMWSVLYFDSTVHAEPPPQGAHIWHSNLDWIVGRTGYRADDLVVAMRSGPPFNHEHADRNSIIIKCFGEGLVVDPMRPPYTFRDPAWKMRLTAGHSAVLIDGQGHEYVDGHEGTNASHALARIIRSEAQGSWFSWTSDATPAYQLTIPDVKAITRTVITLLRIPAVVIVDRVMKRAFPSSIQARFYAYNSDMQGTVDAGEGGFLIHRPFADLRGYAAANTGVSFTSGMPDIPAEQARLYPYVDVVTQPGQKDICLVTVLLPSHSGALAHVDIQRDGTLYHVTITSQEKRIQVSILDKGAIPGFRVH